VISAALADLAVKQYHLDFYIADAEAPYTQTKKIKGWKRSRQFVNTFRWLEPTLPAALTTYGAAATPWVLPIDFAAWRNGSFDLLPQAYYNQFPRVYRPDMTVSHAEREANRGRDLEEWTTRLDERERALAQRETELDKYESTATSQKDRAERRERRASTLEASVQERLKELDDREAALELREAQAEADHEIRLDKLEAREEKVAQLEERLAKQEVELGAYVAKAQTELQRRESQRWQHDDAEVPAA
jgi:hypothetical protein